MSGDCEKDLGVLFVGHEASRTGAPIGFLSLIQWLQAVGGVCPLTVLRHGGVLAEAHEGVGLVAVGAALLLGLAWR
jgi:hypothetical protein